MGEEFYKVSFVDGEDEYYFHDYESASAFLMEAFADDFSDLDEEQFSEANISLADEGFIEDYGEIVTCYFKE